MSFNEKDLLGENMLNNLIKVLDLLLKDVNSYHKRHQDVYYIKTKSMWKKFITIGKSSQNLINKCILNHRFCEAAKLLWVLCQDKACFSFFFQKALAIVFENLRPEKVPDIILEGPKKVICKQNMRLELLMFAFKQHLSDFKFDLQKANLEDGKNHLNKTDKVPLDAFLLGYSALQDYIFWNVNYKRKDLEFQKEVDPEIAITNFKKLLEYDGTWDIFILKLVEMLTYYGRHDEIINILKKYVTFNPDHINAYIYMCVYLFENKIDDKLFIHYSKELAKLCPSDIRVLLLVQKWSDSNKHFKKRLNILFKFLDYPVNKINIIAWNMLSTHISAASESKKSSWLDTVNSLWNMRCDFWDWMYFNPAEASRENLELLAAKVAVLSKLNSNHSFVKEAFSKYPHLCDMEGRTQEDS